MTQTMRVLVAFLAIGLLGTGAVFGQVSRGEIEAAFNGGETGGVAVLFNTNGTAELVAAPSQGFEGLIHPFAEDDIAYPAEDWHGIWTVFLVVADYPTADYLFDQFEVRFEVDGHEIATTQRPLTRDLSYLDFNPALPAFSRVDGKIYAPGELALGPHTVRTVITFFGGPFADHTTRFIIE